jgi:tRNA (adenine57-N1/adenine58-N1)-methyltransferase
MKLRYGDKFILSDNKGNTWLITLKQGGEFHTHYGIIDHDALINFEYGDEIRLKGGSLWILKPTIENYILKIKRKTQIMYPKDIGLLILRCGVKNGDYVLEVGTGSGALTTALAIAVQPDGKIDTYERREDFLELARKNLREYGLDKYVKFHHMDILKAKLKANKYDAVFVDIDSPWLIVEKIWRALKGGATAAFLIPTYNQLEKLLNQLDNYFIDINCIEVFYREILMRKGRIRPSFRMIGYTALLVTAKKVNRDVSTT